MSLLLNVNTKKQHQQIKCLKSTADQALDVATTESKLPLTTSLVITALRHVKDFAPV